MKKLTSDELANAIAEDGHLSLSTYSCGCCSEHYQTDPDSVSPDFTLTEDELVKYIDREQDRLDALREYISDLVAVNGNANTVFEGDDE